MSFVPSAQLLREIALCGACTQDSPAPRAGRTGLCDDHRTRWNLEVCMADANPTAAEQESLHRLVQGLLASGDGGAQLLSAFERQRRALRLVWEAHARGAVRLPDSVAQSVERACSSASRFLPGGAAHGLPFRSAVKHAS